MGTWRVEEGSLNVRERVAGSNAQRPLFPNCKNLGRAKNFEKCRGLECDWNYRLLESDARGPVLVSISVMDTMTLWRRRHAQDSSTFMMEKVDEQRIGD